MVNDSALFPLIPASTAQAARALYGQGNLYLRLGDRLNYLTSRMDRKNISLFWDEDKSSLLTLLTIIQYAEKLTDEQMAESIQRRMELRYALHLATPSPRLDPRSLCAFRMKTTSDPQYRHLFEEMFNQIYPEITSTAMKEETSINEVIDSICENEVRATLVEAMLQSMEVLSANHFHWLRQIALPHWYQRYNRSVAVANLDVSFRKQEFTREDIRGDIQHLLYEIRESNSPDIMEMPETKRLNRMWEELTDTHSPKDCSHCIHVIH
jgi:transposase